METLCVVTSLLIVDPFFPMTIGNSFGSNLRSLVATLSCRMDFLISSVLSGRPMRCIFPELRTISMVTPSFAALNSFMMGICFSPRYPKSRLGTSTCTASVRTNLSISALAAAIDSGLPSMVIILVSLFTSRLTLVAASIFLIILPPFPMTTPNLSCGQSNSDVTRSWVLHSNLVAKRTLANAESISPRLVVCTFHPSRRVVMVALFCWSSLSMALYSSSCSFCFFV
mmetsp:Transcript_42767/g.103456  ORF Transcript_42767/g.103456 Transcript_42767/m.103456 type:complete len:227 (-) Transcript_42767:355-1035(-)